MSEEKCPKCNSRFFASVRDMTSSRICNCGHSWHPFDNRIEALQKENEKLRMQLAACGVAAQENTEDTIKNRLDDSSTYCCASYRDVCDTVDREMSSRKENEILRSKESQYENNMKATLEVKQLLQKENEKLKKQLEIAKNALKIYANSDHEYWIEKTIVSYGQKIHFMKDNKQLEKHAVETLKDIEVLDE